MVPVARPAPVPTGPLAARIAARRPTDRHRRFPRLTDRQFVPVALPTPAALDRGRRRISPAPRRVHRPTDGWRKYRQIPRAGCRCTFPSLPNWRWRISPRPSILRSAEIMASGFLVSSTEPASARYSRCRDSAKRMTMDKIQTTAISTTAIMMAMPAPPLRRRRHRRREPPHMTF